jgi:hypothetical protein
MTLVIVLVISREEDMEDPSLRMSILDELVVSCVGHAPSDRLVISKGNGSVNSLNNAGVDGSGVAGNISGLGWQE